MDDVLIYLARAGGLKHAVLVSTTELGKALGMTQQNASRRLSVLQEKGAVVRTPAGIMLTKKGVSELQTNYAILKAAFEGGVEELAGVITKGLGEGRYYLSLPEYKIGIKEIAGISPFPGTLNLRIRKEDLWKKSALRSQAFSVNPFIRDHRRYGAVGVLPCKIGVMKAALIFPERTHHSDDVVEVVASKNLRKALHKKDGDRVVLRFNGGPVQT
ncbi:MAG: DUF120 domain-containing protein [Candidatus Bilamarchaeaceae archaeon]